MCLLTYGMAPYFQDIFCRVSKRSHFTLYLLMSHTIMFASKTNGFACHISEQFFFLNSEKESVDVHYLNSSFIGKSAVVNVLEQFNSCVESIETKIYMYITSFSDGPNVNLSFLNILDGDRRDAELNSLIDIVTCGLHTIHNL